MYKGTAHQRKDKGYMAYDNSWFENGSDQMFGGMSPAGNEKTIKDIDISALASAIEDIKSNKDEIDNTRERIRKLMKENEKYCDLSAEAFTEVVNARSEFTERIKSSRSKLSDKEREMRDSLSEVELAQRKIASGADSALVQIEGISKDSEKQRQALQSFQDDTKKTILNLNQKYQNTQSQLSGYTTELDDAKRKAHDTVRKFDADIDDIQHEVDSLGVSIEEWRDDFESGAGDFQHKVQNMNVVMEGLLDKIADNAQAIQGIKRSAQQQADEIRESIRKAQTDMHTLDDLCVETETEANREYDKLKKKMTEVNVRFEGNTRLLDRNQRDLEATIRHLEELTAEKEKLVEDCKRDFSEAESVSRTFAEYRRNLIQEGIQAIKSVALGYDQTLLAMTGVPQDSFDILDDKKSEQGMMRQMQDINEQVAQGNSPFGKRKQSQPEPQPIPEPEPRPVQDYQFEKPTYNQQQEYDDYQQTQTHQQYQYQSQGLDNHSPQPRQEEYQQTPQQSNDYGAGVNSDDILNSYLANAGNEQPQQGYDNYAYPPQQGYDNYNQQEQEIPTGLLMDEMNDPAFNQEGNYMGTGTLIGEQGTQLLEGAQNFGEFEMPYTPEPEPVAEPATKRRTTGIFKKWK